MGWDLEDVSLDMFSTLYQRTREQESACDNGLHVFPSLCFFHFVGVVL